MRLGVVELTDVKFVSQPGSRLLDLPLPQQVLLRQLLDLPSSCFIGLSFRLLEPSVATPDDLQ